MKSDVVDVEEVVALHHQLGITAKFVGGQIIFIIDYSSLARARLSHFGRESGQTPIPVLFSRSVLTKQQRAPLIKKRVTGCHESVEIV